MLWTKRWDSSNWQKHTDITRTQINWKEREGEGREGEPNQVC